MRLSISHLNKNFIHEHLGYMHDIIIVSLLHISFYVSQQMICG